MRTLIGALRCALMVIAMVFGFVFILLTGWMGIRISGARLAGWVVTGLARYHNWLFNIRFTCRDPQKIRSHQGFLFPNHSTYLDILSMLSVLPVRFLAESGNKNRPLIGYFASSIDSVFVDRSDRNSRQRARQSIARRVREDPFPPIVIFPEGRLNPGIFLLPFFRGAFEIAIDNSIPYLPCAIRYSNPEIMTWGWRQVKDGLPVQVKESILSSIWRVATSPIPLRIEVVPLDPIHPQPGADAHALSIECKHLLERALNFPPSSDELPEVINYE
ncbi:MAG: 1-acyl-sn-glycerol-3-phosphate acyltransferase [Caldilineaceae bacterium]